MPPITHILNMSQDVTMIQKSLGFTKAKRCSEPNLSLRVGVLRDRDDKIFSIALRRLCQGINQEMFIFFKQQIVFG